MSSRRKFLSHIPAFSVLPLWFRDLIHRDNPVTSDVPAFIATWDNRMATEIALSHLNKNPGDILDAIEIGVNIVESDPEDSSVGLGGLPDSSGEVTLDACIMDQKGRAGSVTYLKNIIHAVSVARKVMEETPHVMLSGKGAEDFALEKGFKPGRLLTARAQARYKEWSKNQEFKPVINFERHDTIGLLGIDADKNISGACSTSGLAFKRPGRVGDSPIPGAGLYVDNEVGAAAATGYGELVLRNCSSFFAVEMMRKGASPEKACREAVLRIIKRENVENTQVGLIAINKHGETGSFSIHKGFNCAISTLNGSMLHESQSYFV